VYAGVYTYGRTESRTQLVDGVAHKSEGHAKPRDQWIALIKGHHPGYIKWNEYESIQRALAENAHVKKDQHRKSGRGGKALLSGKLRCRRCGRMLRVRYAGTNGEQYRYLCRADGHRDARAFCLAFGGKLADRALETEILKIVQPRAFDAALEAEARRDHAREQLRLTRALELEQARYEANLAGRRHSQVDPENRLVASELEARWNAALTKVGDLEKSLKDSEATDECSNPDRQQLMALAHDLPAAWNHPTTDPSLKQRITSILIEEVVADVQRDGRELVLLVHWAGGRHSELRLQRRAHQRKHRTDLAAIEVVRKMAGRWPDKQIASTLNRLRIRTASDDHWTQVRVRALRHRHDLSGFNPSERDESVVALSIAATRLGVGTAIVKKLINAHILPARQLVVPNGPWEIHVKDIESERVREAALRLKNRQPILGSSQPHHKAAGVSLGGAQCRSIAQSDQGAVVRRQWSVGDGEAPGEGDVFVAQRRDVRTTGSDDDPDGAVDAVVRHRCLPFADAALVSQERRGGLNG